MRHQRGGLPDGARRLLAGLVEYLNEYTLIEFKSPSDTLRGGDFQTFLANALLYRSQNQPLLPPERLNLMVIAPRLTRPFREELRLCGVTTTVEEPGIWRIHGGTLGHAMWVLETEVLAERNHPVLTVFSPRLLQEPEAVTKQMREQGDEPLVTYVVQQINQFRLQGEQFAMQHLGTEAEMDRVYDELFRTMPLRTRLKILADLSPEERLKGMSPAQVVAALSPEERARVRRLLEQEEKKKPKRGKKA